MKENKNMINISGVPLIITCPVCGFTFRFFDPITGKKVQKCPICNCNLLKCSKLRLENFINII
ncbi:MAG: hypothetical protein ACFFDF_02140 [Candidatus Odinarchaeota archaeon]